MKTSQTKLPGTQTRGLQRVPCSARTMDHCQGWEHSVCLFTQPTVQAGRGFNIQHRYRALATHGTFYSHWKETGTGRGQSIQPAFDIFPDGINLSLQSLPFPQLTWGTYKPSFRPKIFQCKIAITKCIVYIFFFFFLNEWHNKYGREILENAGSVLAGNFALSCCH